jgi:hypothetical protein
MARAFVIALALAAVASLAVAVVVAQPPPNGKVSRRRLAQAGQNNRGICASA